VAFVILPECSQLVRPRGREELKKKRLLQAVNEARLVQMDTQNAVVELSWVFDPEAELDQMWSFVESKSQQR
jgi:hypothetical protein